MIFKTIKKSHSGWNGFLSSDPAGASFDTRQQPNGLLWTGFSPQPDHILVPIMNFITIKKATPNGMASL
jgi:hypothetical protein